MPRDNVDSNRTDSPYAVAAVGDDDDAGYDGADEAEGDTAGTTDAVDDVVRSSSPTDDSTTDDFQWPVLRCGDPTAEDSRCPSTSFH